MPDERRFTAVDLKRATERGKVMEAAKTDAVNVIASKLLSIRPEHSDEIHPQYPPSAGVMRMALRQAFDAGIAALALVVVQDWKGPGT